MRKLLLTIALFTAVVSTAYAHHPVDSYSWKEPVTETINIPTENTIYENKKELVKASSLVVDVVWTGARKTKESSTGSLYTVSQIKIKKTIKGKSSLKISIVEPAYQLDGVLYQYDNYEFLKKNKTYRLYLVKVKGNWTPINPSQGKEDK